MYRGNRKVQAASETGEGPADAHGHSRDRPQPSRYAGCRATARDKPDDHADYRRMLPASSTATRIRDRPA